MGINLDEARVARREAAGEAPTVTVGGKVYTLPLEMPLEVVIEMKVLGDAMRAKDGEAIAESLLKLAKMFLGKQYDEFRTNGLSIGDLSVFIEGIPEEYGLTLGESTASGKPSKRTTARAKPRSKPTTE